jgi:hypothetical protein
MPDIVSLLNLRLIPRLTESHQFNASMTPPTAAPQEKYVFLAKDAVQLRIPNFAMVNVFLLAILAVPVEVAVRQMKSVQQRVVAAHLIRRLVEVATAITRPARFAATVDKHVQKTEAVVV